MTIGLLAAGCVASQNMPARLQNTSEPPTTIAAVIGQTHVSSERTCSVVRLDSSCSAIVHLHKDFFEVEVVHRDVGVPVCRISATSRSSKSATLTVACEPATSQRNAPGTAKLAGRSWRAVIRSRFTRSLSSSSSPWKRILPSPRIATRWATRSRSLVICVLNRIVCCSVLQAVRAVFAETADGPTDRGWPPAHRAPAVGLMAEASTMPTVCNWPVESEPTRSSSGTCQAHRACRRTPGSSADRTRPCRRSPGGRASTDSS